MTKQYPFTASAPLLGTITLLIGCGALFAASAPAMAGFAAGSPDMAGVAKFDQPTPSATSPEEPSVL